MRKIFLIITFILFTLSVTTSANNLDIDKSILNIIKSIGIDASEVELELEPNELISYEEYSKKDLYEQKTNEAAWSTIWHDNLEKLDVLTKGSLTFKGYLTNNLFDNKVDTAWVEGANGDGIGEWISIVLNAKRTDRPTGMLYFGMIPGYLKSDKIWKENNRVKTALLIVQRYTGYDIRTKSFRYDYPIIRLKFKDFKGLQVFNLLDYGAPPTYDPKRLWVIIENVYKGTKYNDTCISEIVVSGTCAPGEDEGEE